MSKKNPPERLMFTSLDGTLMDREARSCKPAEWALKLATEMNVPVILCSGTTRAEIEHHRKALKNSHPFIVEGGGAIYIPEGCFRHTPPGSRKNKPYHVIPLGKPYKDLRKAMESMRKKGIKVKGFGDMRPKEIQGLTGLTKEQARLARKREFSEPFVLKDPEQEQEALELIRKGGLQATEQGRLRYLSSGSYTGLAVKVLTGIYSHEAGKPVVTAGICASSHDLSLLMAVHVPYLLPGKDGRHAFPKGRFISIKEPGPEGWSLAATQFLKEGV